MEKPVRKYKMVLQLDHPDLMSRDGYFSSVTVQNGSLVPEKYLSPTNVVSLSP